MTYIETPKHISKVLLNTGVFWEHLRGWRTAKFQLKEEDGEVVEIGMMIGKWNKKRKVPYWPPLFLLLKGHKHFLA